MLASPISLRKFSGRFAAACLLTACLVVTGRAEDRPNIVVVVTDDQRYDQLGCTGHPVLKTPNIDRLAAQGILFRNSFCVLPLCSPNRASILTGLYPHAHRVINNDKLGHDFISHTLNTFPRRLRETGYETAFIGKWHMGMDDSRRPGFDRWFSFKGQGAYIDGVVNDDGLVRQMDGYMTDILNEQAVAWVSKSRAKPFCLYLSHKGVHAPYLPAERHESLYADYTFTPPQNLSDDLVGKLALTRKLPPFDRFAVEGVQPEPGESRRGRGREPASVVRDQMRCLTSIDEGIGQLLAALEKSGQLDRTVFVYTADNGYLMGEHGQFDNKRWPYEEALRVPLVIRYPARIRAGGVCDRMVLSIDLAPTLLDLGGIEPLEPMHGRSLAPLFDDPQSPWREAALFEYFLEKVAPQTPTWRAVRTDAWKYVHYPENSAWDELYDLRNDPREQHNLADASSSAPTLATLRDEMQRLLSQSGHPDSRSKTRPAKR